MLAIRKSTNFLDLGWIHVVNPRKICFPEGWCYIVDEAFFIHNGGQFEIPKIFFICQRISLRMVSIDRGSILNCPPLGAKNASSTIWHHPLYAKFCEDQLRCLYTERAQTLTGHFVAVLFIQPWLVPQPSKSANVFNQVLISRSIFLTVASFQ